MVEQQTFNLRVVGSIPARRTKYSRGKKGGFFMNHSLFETLRERGYIYQCTNLQAVKALLESEQKITFYLGIDPTADSLHIGHFFALMMFRYLQDAGHHGIVVIGGATAMIGDPSGKCDMRKMLSREQVQHNFEEVRQLVQRFVRTEGENPAIILNNADWMEQYSYVDFMRLVGVHFNVNTMLSSNLPHNVSLNNADWSTNIAQELTPEGVYNIRGGVDNASEGEIIVDNEDASLFSLSRPLRTGYLSKWIDKARENKNEFVYEGFSDWRTYSQWTLVTDQKLYGDYIRSAYIISPGDGAQYARWSVPVPVAGVYDVFFHVSSSLYENNRNRRWNNNFNNGRNNNGRRVTNDYNFEIEQFNMQDRVSLNMFRAEDGWNLLGTFRFEADTVNVTLNNRSGVTVIVADAVKLVKRER